MASVDFDTINAAALTRLGPILCRWLLDGRVGGECTARNSRRDDRLAGSVKVTLCPGPWLGLGTGNRGSDPNFLKAYLPRTDRAAIPSAAPTDDADEQTNDAIVALLSITNH